MPNIIDREQAAPASRASAVFPSFALASLLGERGLAPGFAFGDWEYGRRDLQLPAGYVPSAPTYGSFLIVERETVYETNGRIRTDGRRTTHSIRGGQVR